MAKKRKDQFRDNTLEKRAKREKNINRLSWLKIQFMRLFFDRSGLAKDISKWSDDHAKEIRKTVLTVIVIIFVSLVIAVILNSILSSITVYKNGTPIYGPGTK